jgi:glutamyl-tRNA(Gln) amidotransferase subunit E
MDLTETRFAADDGSTFFLRPMPGRERMYPETDVPILRISDETIHAMRNDVPLPMEETISMISRDYGLSAQDAYVIVSTFRKVQLDELSSLYKHPKIVARFIMQTLPELEKKYGRKIEQPKLTRLFAIAGEKNWIREVLEKAADLMLSGRLDPDTVAGEEELSQLGEDELREIIVKLLASSESETNERNIIARVKKETGRPFDAAQAMKVFKALSKV